MIDASFDYQVWNQPVYSYQYTYFNPKTLIRTEKLEEAKVALSEITADRFKKYRSQSAKSVVGIAMELTYMVETSPTPMQEDDEKYDSQNTVVYLYDLELNDQEGSIRINIRYISHYRPFVDEAENILGTIVDFASGDSHLVSEMPDELDKLLELYPEEKDPAFLS